MPSPHRRNRSTHDLLYKSIEIIPDSSSPDEFYEKYFHYKRANDRATNRLSHIRPYCQLGVLYCKLKLHIILYDDAINTFQELKKELLLNKNQVKNKAIYGLITSILPAIEKTIQDYQSDDNRTTYHLNYIKAIDQALDKKVELTHEIYRYSLEKQTGKKPSVSTKKKTKLKAAEKKEISTTETLAFESPSPSCNYFCSNFKIHVDFQRQEILNALEVIKQLFQFKSLTPERLTELINLQIKFINKFLRSLTNYVNYQKVSTQKKYEHGLEKHKEWLNKMWAYCEQIDVTEEAYMQINNKIKTSLQETTQTATSTILSEFKKIPVTNKEKVYYRNQYKQHQNLGEDFANVDGKDSLARKKRSRQIPQVNKDGTTNHDLDYADKAKEVESEDHYDIKEEEEKQPSAKKPRSSPRLFKPAPDHKKNQLSLTSDSAASILFSLKQSKKGTPQ